MYFKPALPTVWLQFLIAECLRIRQERVSFFSSATAARTTLPLGHKTRCPGVSGRITAASTASVSTITRDDRQPTGGGLAWGGWSTLSTRSQHLSSFLLSIPVGAALFAGFARVRVLTTLRTFLFPLPKPPLTRPHKTVPVLLPPARHFSDSRSKMERGPWS